MHDPLTGLPNRVFFQERLDRTLIDCCPQGRAPAVLLVGIDRFRLINDTYGTHVGDELLVAAGRRLSAVLRRCDSLARLTDDEFAILCEQSDDARQIYSLAPEVATAMSEPYLISGVRVSATASVGIAVAEVQSELRCSGELMREAFASMYGVRNAAPIVG